MAPSSPFRGMRRRDRNESEGGTEMRIVEIGTCQDPDHPRRGGMPPREIVQVANLLEASDACMRYIDTHDLGGGSWDYGRVREQPGGPVLALISYNGRAWVPG